MPPHLRIETDQALLPAGWCWCGQIWMIAQADEFAEGGLLHSREGCWARDRAHRPLGLVDALDTTYPCCEHCPCQGREHVVACPVDGCEGQVGS
jgi:hypothetical protein